MFQANKKWPSHPSWTRLLLLLSFILILGTSNQIRAQNLTGQSSLSGVVTDNTGAAVVGADVAVINTETNVTTDVITNSTGYFLQDNLNAGHYDIKVTAKGFQTLTQSGITLEASERRNVPVKLNVGSESTSVIVNSDAPLLETESVSTGQTITSAELDSLPNGTSSIYLAMLAPGTQSQLASNYQQNGGSNSLNTPSQSFGAYGRIGANEFSLDGAPNMGNNRGTAISPTADELGQVKIISTAFDAQQEHTFGVTFIQTTKAGTNDIHGTARLRYDNSTFDAFQHFQKLTYLYQRRIAGCDTSPKSSACQLATTKFGLPTNEEYAPSGSIGGPVYIPHVFDGRNKLFFFAAFYRIGFGGGTPKVAAVPTAQERTGNFSDLPQTASIPTTVGYAGKTFAQNCPGSPFFGAYQIYNPFQITFDSKEVPHRAPFCGNVLPSNLLSSHPLVAAVNAAYSNPSQANTPTGNNLNYNAITNGTYEQFTNRFDYALNEANHFFFRYSLGYYTLATDDFTNTDIGQLSTPRFIKNASFGWAHSLSANTVVTATVGASDYTGNGSFYPNEAGYNASDLGLPSYIDDYSGSAAAFPVVSVSSYTSVTAAATNYSHYRTLSFRGDVTTVRGAHAISLGAEWRQQNVAFDGAGSFSGAGSAGTFAFDNTYTQEGNGTTSSFPTTAAGTSYASLLLGINTSASIYKGLPYSRSNPYYTFYAGDVWRVTRKLTIIPGLRYEFEYGPTDKHNQQMVGWDPNASLTIAPAARTAYANTYSTASAALKAILPPSITVAGGPIYAGVNGASTRQWQNNWRFMPRLGLSYAFTPKTVLRAGYGLFYDSLSIVNENGTTLNGGFSSLTGPVATSDTTHYGSNFTPGSTPLSDPFPESNGSRFVSQVGSSLGADYYSAYASTLGVYNHDRVPARSNRVQFSVEHQFKATTLVQIAYVASRTTDITLDGNANNTHTNTATPTINSTAIPASFFAGGLSPNALSNTLLTQKVANPFYVNNFSGLATTDPALYNQLSKSSYSTSSTIQVANLVRPYPQMSGLQLYQFNGTSQFQEIQVNAFKRVSDGLTATLAYQWNYQKDRDYYQNAFDTHPSLESSNQSPPWRFTASAVYRLPWGRGQQWLQHGWKEAVFGGYVLAATAELQPGPLLNFPNLFYVGDVKAIKLKKPTYVQNDATGVNYVQSFNAAPVTMLSYATAANGAVTCSYTGTGFVDTLVTNYSVCQPNAYNLRVFPTHVEGVRQQGIANYNANLGKTFSPTDRIRFTPQLYVFNLFNHQRSAGATTSPTNTQFGQTNSDQSGANARGITLAFLLNF
jgi:hypothetical protein